MNAGLAIAALLVVALLAYLGVALLWPEKFE
jgi:K+-transporting ATPase KdpF subunit